MKPCVLILGMIAVWVAKVVITRPHACRLVPCDMVDSEEELAVSIKYGHFMDLTRRKVPGLIWCKEKWDGVGTAYLILEGVLNPPVTGGVVGLQDNSHACLSLFIQHLLVGEGPKYSKRMYHMERAQPSVTSFPINSLTIWTIVYGRKLPYL